MEKKAPHITTSVTISPHLKKRADAKVKEGKFSSFSDFISISATEKLTRMDLLDELGISVCCPPTGGKAKKLAPGRSDSARQQPKTENNPKK